MKKDGKFPKVYITAKREEEVSLDGVSTVINEIDEMMNNIYEEMLTPPSSEIIPTHGENNPK